MKKWNWRSYFAGTITTALIFGCGVTAFASNYMIDRISFNSVKIGTPTSTITNENNSYTLQSGEFVPYSIVYTGSNGGGTVYLPIRKISEFTKTGIEWDGAKNKVVIDADTTIAYNNVTGSYSDGYSDGYNDALSHNSTSSNYNSGYNDGYDDGYDAGKKVNSTNGNYQTGYNDGYTAGEAQGVAEGEKSGYDNGFADGEKIGYQEGYEDGYADGKDGAEQKPGGTDNPSDPGGSDVEFDRNSVSEEDMLKYLQENVPQKIETPLGTYSFTFDVYKNSNKNAGIDFWITTSEPLYPSWYEFENSIDLDPDDIKETLSILKEYQKKVYDAAWACAPGAKMEGSFHSSGYKYPSIQEGYHSTNVFSWKNYGPNKYGAYDETYYTGFEWTPQYDDYKF